MLVLRSRSTREGSSAGTSVRCPTFPSLLTAIDQAASLDELLTLRAAGCERFHGDERRALVDARVALRVLGLITHPDA